MGHALARSVDGILSARALLGLGESGNFPASIKTVASGFRKERALATGIINAGRNMGAVVAPLAVPWIALTWGWRGRSSRPARSASSGWSSGSRSIASRRSTRRSRPRNSRYIREIGSRYAVSGFRGCVCSRYRQTWAFVVGKALTDPVWHFYLFWLPKFLDANFGVKLSGLAAPLVAIYVLADVGSVAGGWLSGALIQRGLDGEPRRKTAMLIAALLIVPTLLAPRAGSMWAAVAMVSVAAGAHQWWSANLFTSVSDMFPPSAVGSVVGIGGFGGRDGRRALSAIDRRDPRRDRRQIRDHLPVCGLAYVAAWVFIHLLVPRTAQG